VVITGVGICAPLTFQELVEGHSALTLPEDWSVPGLTLRVGSVPGDVAAAVRALPGGWRAGRLDPVSMFALLAADAARRDCGLEAPQMESAAVLVASAMGGERTHDGASRQLAEHLLAGAKLRFSPFTAPKLMPNAASACVAMLLGAHGPNASPAAACASGAYALAQGADLIRLERSQVVVAGAAEAPCVEIAARAFLAGGALSPAGRSLPFHRERDGFVLAEGAAVMVLEELEHARRRGAKMYAELAGAGLTCDAHHIVAPHPDGVYAARAMRAALAEARLSPDGVDYINAHATGTPVGDLVECRAIRSVFGDRLPPTSATKGATGHLLGAAGALEAAFAVLAIAARRLPPTVGLTPQGIDPECAAGGFDFVPDAGREASVQTALSNSFAFGGHNASLLFRRLD